MALVAVRFALDRRLESLAKGSKQVFFTREDVQHIIRVKQQGDNTATNVRRY